MNNSKISNEAALDLWAQMMERAGEHEWSTFDDPDYEHPGRDKATIRKAFLDAGWSERDIDTMTEVRERRSNDAPVTSPGVARFTEADLHRLSQCIKLAAAELGLQNRDKVHFSVEPKAGPIVSKINVVMTDQSIVTIGSFFTRYCGLVSRAYVRSTLLFPFSTGVDFDEDYCRLQLRRNPDLLFYWWRIFVSFAVTGTHALAPFRPSNINEVILMEQMAFAMEIFGLSHEYAHHTLDHGRVVADDEAAKQEEFEADALALRICNVVARDQEYKWIKGEYLPNPYLWTGAGAILLLGSLDIFRKVKDRIFLNKKYSTHPEFTQRCQKILSRHVAQPQKFMSSRDFCGSAENVLRCVMLELEPIMKIYPFAKMAEASPGDWEVLSY